MAAGVLGPYVQAPEEESQPKFFSHCKLAGNIPWQLSNYPQFCFLSCRLPACVLPSTRVHVCMHVRVQHMLLSVALPQNRLSHPCPTPLGLSLRWNVILPIPGTIHGDSGYVHSPQRANRAMIPPYHHHNPHWPLSERFLEGREQTELTRPIHVLVSCGCTSNRNFKKQLLQGR